MSYPSALEALLDKDEFAVRGAIRVTLPTSGVHGFWNGSGTIEIGGVTYQPNSLIQVELPSMVIGPEATGLCIILTESAEFGITPDVLASIEEQQYKAAGVVIYDLFFDPNSRTLLHVEGLFEGEIDTIDHVREGGETKLVVNVITKALDNFRDGYRTASHADQQLVSPGDRALEHAGMVRNETFKITWRR